MTITAQKALRPVQLGTQPLGIISQFREAWQHGDRLSVKAFLDRRGGIALDRSSVLDIAYEEFCLRTELGEAIEVDAFAAQFPSVRLSLARLLSVHRYLSNSCFTALGVPTAWPQINDEVLGFHLLEELGRGAFARVYLAAEVALSRRMVVVKMAVGGEAEAEIIAKLQHPRVIPINSVHNDSASGLTLICMPYCGRATLSDVIAATAGNGLAADPGALQLALAAARKAAGRDMTADSEQTSIVTALSIVMGVGEALAFAHSQGICHQDLKPSNVVLTFTGEPLLLDFNLSTDGRPVEKLGGTLHYMASEQIETMLGWEAGVKGKFDPRSDIFAWGVMTVELLSGCLPFQHVPPESADLWHELLASRRRAPVIKLPKSIAPDLVELLQACLAYSPADRPQTARALVDSLQEIALSRAELSAGRSRQVSPAYRRGSRIVAAAAVVAAAVCLATQPPSPTQSHLEIAAAAYRETRDNLAIEHLNRALDADPKSTQALILRGRCHQRLRKYIAAFTDYETAYQLTADPRLCAGCGFCIRQDGSDSAAVYHYQQAILGGYTNAAICNNLGLSFMRLGRREDALRNLDRAIAINPRLQAPFLNRATLLLNDSRQTGVVLQTALSDVRKAVALGPDSGELFFIAAALYSIAARSDERLQTAATDFLTLAIRHGYGRELLKYDSAFDLLRNDQQFLHLLDLPSESVACKLAIRELDPLTEEVIAR